MAQSGRTDWSERDIADARRDTPACAGVIHLNNAGAALSPSVVTETVMGHLRREQEIGGYEAAAEAEGRQEAVYTSIATLLGCERSEVALVENASRAWDMAFYSLPLRPGQRVLASRAEYSSNALGLLQVARRSGVRLELVDDDEHGVLSLEDLQRRLDRGGEVGLVAVTHVPTHNGLVNPAAQIGRITRAAGVPYLLDACQSVGQLPTLVGQIGCDMLSATSRKFLRGPRGAGLLFVRGELVEQLQPPMVDNVSAEWTGPDSYRLAGGARRFETYESSIAVRLGLGAAVDYALAVGVDRIAVRVQALAARLRERLRELPGVAVHDRGLTPSAIVTFTAAGHDSTELAAALRRAGVNTSVSVSSATWFDPARARLPDVVRASVHYYNTEGELDRTVALLAGLLTPGAAGATGPAARTSP